MVSPREYNNTRTASGQKEPLQLVPLEEPIARAISKPAMAGIVFSVLLFGVILYQTVAIRQVECNVCVDFEGRTKCLRVRGEDEAQAIQTGKDNACSFVTVGRAEAFRCAGEPPASTECRPL